jgi:glycosyltransferase involved in cell wall biosynthesis
MTAYNNPEYIPAAIESVLDQDIGEVQFIFVDDGSTDDVLSVVAPYKDKIQLVQQDNQGLSAARNNAVELAKNEFIAFCDADDIQLDYRLSTQEALLRAYPTAGMVSGDFQSFQGNEIIAESALRAGELGLDNGDFEQSIYRAFGEPSSCRELGIVAPEALLDRPVYKGKVPALIASRHIAWGGASMFRKEALTAVGGHDPKIRYWEDWCLSSRIS